MRSMQAQLLKQASGKYHFFSLTGHKIITYLSFNDSSVISLTAPLLSSYWEWIKLQIMTNMNPLVLSFSVQVIHHQLLFAANVL